MTFHTLILIDIIAICRFYRIERIGIAVERIQRIYLSENTPKRNGILNGLIKRILILIKVLRIDRKNIFIVQGVIRIRILVDGKRSVFFYFRNVVLVATNNRKCGIVLTLL